MLSRIILITTASCLLLTASTSAQELTNPATDEIVRRASAQLSVYVQTFKNLLSEETKTFEIYDRKGAVKKRRVVHSTFRSEERRVGKECRSRRWQYQ